LLVVADEALVLDDPGKVRSTTQRRLSTSKPLVAGLRLTISMTMWALSLAQRTSRPA
jgi:hypothetical protein